MDTATTRNLISRLLGQVEANATEQAHGMMSVPSSDFLCPQRFERERRQFFLDSPHVLGFAGQVREPGSFMTAEAMGIPVVIARDPQGVLRAFVNACAHRGARVAHGAGSRPRLSCRFHGWAYSLDGSLFGRPEDSCFDRPAEACGLTRLPISDRSGLLVVGLRPDLPVESVEKHLAGIEGQFVGFGFDMMNTLETRRYEVNANWKLIAALSYESYHFATLHRDSVAHVLRSNAVYDTFDRHTRWAFPLKGIEHLRSIDEKEWPAAVPGAVSHALFPGTVVITNPEDAQIIRTEPGRSVDTAVVYYSGVCRHAEKKEEARAAYEFGGQAFENEDLPAAVETQAGIAARGEDFLVGSNEPILQWWCRRWQEALAD